MMNRYWLFAGLAYYPMGGMDDFKGSFQGLEEAMQGVRKEDLEEDWGHIFDTLENKVIFKFDRNYGPLEWKVV